MTKKLKQTYLSIGTILTITGSVVSVVSCAGYKPTRNDLSTRNFLSGKHAYNKVLSDYYSSVVDAMYSDKDNTIQNINLDNLRFDTYQWSVTANALKDNQYWGAQRNTWITNGTFIDLKNPNLNTLAQNEDFVNKLFKTTPNGDYILNSDNATFLKLQGLNIGDKPTGKDIGSGVIMDVNRQLFSMGYLLLTKKQDVQNWLIGDPNNPSSKGKGTIRTDEQNQGQYFFIDYLRQSKPFIMWKNEQKASPDASATFTGTTAADSAKFNKLGQTIISQERHPGSLTLQGGPVAAGAVPSFSDLDAFGSYNGLQTTNPFIKNGSNPRHGNIDPKDSYMKAHPGGYQGWINNDGQVLQNKGNAVSLDATTRDYAYIQQVLPAWDTSPAGYPSGAFRMPDWMTTQNTNNPGTEVKSLWNIAFQIGFTGADILSQAKNYWIHNGYSLKVFIPDLEDNLSPAHIYK